MMDEKGSLGLARRQISIDQGVKKMEATYAYAEKRRDIMGLVLVGCDGGGGGKKDREERIGLADRLGPDVQSSNGIVSMTRRK